MMLREIRNVMQVPGEPFRRWFQDPDRFDLIVWEDTHANPIGFQLSFDWQVITYANHSFSFAISTGERIGTRKGSEVLIDGGKQIDFNTQTAEIERFKEDSRAIDLVIRHYVIEKLELLRAHER